MMLFNKWIRMDLILMAAVLVLSFMKSGRLKDAVLGIAAALLILSIVQHIRHYQSYKKFS